MSPNSRSEHHLIDWSIENFSMLMGDDKKTLTSRVTIADYLHETSWSALLFSHGSVDSPNWIAVGLERSKADCGPCDITLQCEVCLIATDGSEQERTVFVTQPIKKGGKALHKIITRDHLLSEAWKFLPEDTLSIRFRISSHIVPAFSRTVATTTVPSEAVDIEWTIDDLSCSCAHSFTLSKLFAKPLRMEMVFEPARQVVQEENAAEQTSETKINVRVVDDDKEDFHMWGRISVLDSKDKTHLAKEGENLFSEEVTGGEEWAFPNFFDLSKLREERETLLPGNKLRLKCMFLVWAREQRFEFNQKSLTSTNAKKTLSSDLRQLLQFDKYPDVKLTTEGGHVQPAHRWILASRSKVFLDMFEKLALDNVLGQTGGMDASVSDVDQDTLYSLLHYLYTDECRTLDFNDYLRLYSACVQFRNVSLKAACFSFLKQQFDSRNVYDALVLADRTGESQLRLAAQNYIAERSRAILLTDEWEEFGEREPALAKLVMCDLKVRHQEKVNEAFVV